MKKQKFLIIFCIAAVFTLQACSKQKQKIITKHAIHSQKKVTTKTKNSIAPLDKEIIGDLKLNNKEKKQVSKLINQLKTIGNSDPSKKEEVLNKLNDLLNYLTQKKFTDKKKLSKAQKAFSAYHNISPDNLEASAKVSLATLGVFKINNGQIYPSNIDEVIDEKSANLWNNLKKVFPAEKLSEFACFAPFAVKNDGHGYIGGYVGNNSEVPNPNNCTLGMNTEINLGTTAHDLFHEYGHLISLNLSQVEGEILKFDNLHQFSDLKFKKNSYMKAFYKTFYENSENLQLLANKKDDGYLFYLRNYSKFCSLYSTTNIFEDFAESFAHFIVDKKNDHKGAERKKFFTQYPELVKLKKECNKLCAKNKIKPKTATF